MTSGYRMRIVAALWTQDEHFEGVRYVRKR